MSTKIILPPGKRAFEYLKERHQKDPAVQARIEALNSQRDGALLRGEYERAAELAENLREYNQTADSS